MIKYILSICEGSLEELMLNDDVVCRISRTPVNLIRENLHKVTITLSDKSTYTCEYDMDITIQPGQRHSLLDIYGKEIAASVINSYYNEELIIGDVSYSINKDRERNEISFYDGDQIVAIIKGYCYYRGTNIFCKETDRCEIWLDEAALESHMKLLPCIIAAFPSFEICF